MLGTGKARVAQFLVTDEWTKASSVDGRSCGFRYKRTDEPIAIEGKFRNVTEAYVRLLYITWRLSGPSTFLKLKV